MKEDWLAPREQQIKDLRDTAGSCMLGVMTQLVATLGKNVTLQKNLTCSFIHSSKLLTK